MVPHSVLIHEVAKIDAHQFIYIVHPPKSTSHPVFDAFYHEKARSEKREAKELAVGWVKARRRKKTGQPREEIV